MTIIGAILAAIQMIVAAVGAGEVNYQWNHYISDDDCVNSDSCREVGRFTNSQ